MKLLQIEQHLEITPRAHKIKIAAKNLVVPVRTIGDNKFLAKGGFPTEVSKVVFCNNPCCELIDKIEKPKI